MFDLSSHIYNCWPSNTPKRSTDFLPGLIYGKWNSTSINAVLCNCPNTAIKVNSYTQCQDSSQDCWITFLFRSYHWLVTNWHGNRNIDYVCDKAMKLIGFLNHNLHTHSEELKKLSYKQFMFPVLDYASSIWDPYYQNQINQHRAACYICIKSTLEKM